jgi:hypothetical protein
LSDTIKGKPRVVSCDPVHHNDIIKSIAVRTGKNEIAAKVTWLSKYYPLGMLRGRIAEGEPLYLRFEAYSYRWFSIISNIHVFGVGL